MMWFQHKETKVRYRRMMKPFDNIYVGTDPRDGFTKKDADFFDVIVNVSDSPGSTFFPSNINQRTYWYPINELGSWGYGVFFWAKQVLDHHHGKKHKIFIHCHSGSHRSPAIFRWWLVSRGFTLMRAIKQERHGIYPWAGHVKSKLMKDHWMNYDGKAGYIPKNLKKMFALMNRNPTWSLMGILRSGKHKLDTTTEVFIPQIRKHKKVIKRTTSIVATRKKRSR